MDRKCTRRIGTHLETRKGIWCDQPAEYIVTAINPDTGWQQIDFLCAGCAGHALSRAETAATLQTHQAPDADPRKRD